MRNQKARSAKTGFFAIGKVWSATGQLIAGVEHGFLDLNVDSGFVNPSLMITMISTAYVRAFTRTPSLWKHFAPRDETNPQTNTAWEGDIRKKAVITSICFVGFLSFLAAGCQSDFGSNKMLDFISKHDLPAISAIKISTAVYAIICALMVEYTFVIKKGLTNAVALYEKILQVKLGQSQLNYKEIIKNILQTGMVGTLGTFAFSAFAYFNIEFLLKNVLLKEVVQMLCIISFLAVFLLNISSRLGETYKYFHNHDDLNLSQLNKADKMLLLPHIIIGSTDIVVYTFAHYAAVIATFQGIGADQDALWVKITGIPFAVSCGALHYMFSIRPMIQTAIKYLNERKSLETMRASSSTEERVNLV